MLSSKRDMKIKGKRISVFILPLQGYMQQTVLQENLSYVLYSKSMFHKQRTVHVAFFHIESKSIIL